MTALISTNDIEWKNGKSSVNIRQVDVFAMYMFRERKLMLLKSTDNLEISLEPFNFELITVSPVVMLANKCVEFAPIGLVNMLNSGGAIQSLVYDDDANSVQIGIKGTGEMRAFASEKPRACLINEKEVTFAYEENLVMIQVPWPSDSGISVINYLF